MFIGYLLYTSLTGTAYGALSLVAIRALTANTKLSIICSITLAIVLSISFSLNELSGRPSVTSFAGLFEFLFIWLDNGIWCIGWLGGIFIATMLISTKKTNK